MLVHHTLLILLRKVQTDCFVFLLLKNFVPVLVRGFYEIDFVISQTTIKDGEGNGNPLQYSCLENPIGSQELDST